MPASPVTGFRSKLVSKTCEIYRSADDATSANLALETIAWDLTDLSIRLGHSLRPANATGGLSPNEQALEDINMACASEARKNARFILLRAYGNFYLKILER